MIALKTRKDWEEYLFGDYFHRRDKTWYALFRKYNLFRNIEEHGPEEIDWEHLRIKREA